MRIRNPLSRAGVFSRRPLYCAGKGYRIGALRLEVEPEKLLLEASAGPASFHFGLTEPAPAKSRRPQIVERIFSPLERDEYSPNYSFLALMTRTPVSL